MPRNRLPDILRVLEQAEGPLTVREIAKAADCSRTTAGIHMTRLRASGQVEAEREQRNYRRGNNTYLYRLPQIPFSPFDGDPWWSEIAAAMNHAARERKEKNRG